MSESKPQCIRLLSYNIHGCVGRGDREDPNGILEVIEQSDADFVALQEVQDNDTADLSFLRGLEKLSFVETVYGKTMRKPLGEYGNIFLSRHRLSHVECLDISHHKREPRGIIYAESESYGIPLHLMSTHLGLRRKERSKQVCQVLAARADKQTEPGSCVDVLMGDMNEWFTHGTNMRRLRDNYAYCSVVRTFPAGWPLFSLDRILLDGPIEAVRFMRIDSRRAKVVSDHRPLLAEFTVRP